MLSRRIYNYIVDEIQDAAELMNEPSLTPEVVKGAIDTWFVSTMVDPDVHWDDHWLFPYAGGADGEYVAEYLNSRGVSDEVNWQLIDYLQDYMTLPMMSSSIIPEIYQLDNHVTFHDDGSLSWTSSIQVIPGRSTMEDAVKISKLSRYDNEVLSMTGEEYDKIRESIEYPGRLRPGQEVDLIIESFVVNNMIEHLNTHNYVPQPILDLIRDTLDIRHQLFATTLTRDPSMSYTNVLEYDGSYEIFGATLRESGDIPDAIEVNPPPYNVLLDYTIDIVNDALSSPDDSNTFFLIVPSDSYDLINSQYTQFNLDLPNDITLLILQNSQGSIEYPIPNTLYDDVMDIVQKYY